MNVLKIKLDTFEGPLDLLPPLIRKGEIEAKSISILNILSQLIEKEKNTPSEDDFEKEVSAISPLAHLLLLKSEALLPPTKATNIEEEILQEEFNLKLLEKLVEYCRFKEAADSLSLKEENARVCFSRQSTHLQDPKKFLGIEHLSLDEFSSLFKEVLKKAKSQTGTIQEEKWQIGDKIISIRETLKVCDKIDFLILFSSSKSREELIVLFLAILELMKLGEISVIRKDATIFINAGNLNG